MLVAMKDGDNVTQDQQTGASSNPIADMLAAKNSPAPAPAAEPQGGQEQQAQTADNQQVTNESNTEDVQSEQSQEHTEAAQAQLNNDATGGAEGLENTEGDNPDQTQGSDNTEGQVAPDSQDDWWKEEGGGAFDTSETTELPDGDYSAIGKAIGVESGNPQEVMSKISEITKQNQEYAEKVKSLEENSNFATPELAEANEIARNGGDYRSYLALQQTDWDSIPDEALIVEGKLRAYFGENEEGMMAHLNQMSDIEKKMMADSIRQDAKANDAAAKQRIKDEANQRAQKIDQGIRSTLDNTNEMFGLKLTPAMKREIYDDITGKNLLKTIFHDNNGNPDPGKMVKAAVALKNLNKIVSTAVTKARNSGVEEVLTEATNPRIDRSGEMVNPQVKEQPTAFDSHFAQLKEGKK